MPAFLGRLFRLACVLIVACAILSHAPAAAAGGIVGTGSAASCTEAAFDSIFYAAMSSGGGTITFDCGAAPHTIIFSGQKAIAADLEIGGGGLITLSGGNATSLFQVFAGKTLTLHGLTLTRSYGPVGAIENFGTLAIVNSQLIDNAASAAGGALANHGATELTNVVVADNTAAQAGGGIYSDAGTMAITNSRFARNKTTDVFGEGGALHSMAVVVITTSAFTQNNASRGGAISLSDGTTTINQSLIEQNWASYGGGIRQTGGNLTLAEVTLAGNGYATNGSRVTTGGGALSMDGGTASLANMTMNGNWASYGGAIDLSSGTMTLTNATISGNTAVGAGAIDQGGGSMTLTNVTIAFNQAPFFAGGIANRGGTASLKNTLLAENLNPDTNRSANCYQPITASSFSMSSDYTCRLGTGRDNANPALGPLANNGGLTQTHLPQAGSDTIDMGTGSGCPITDQRMVARPQGQACDVGSVEIAAADLLSKVYLPQIQR